MKLMQKKDVDFGCTQKFMLGWFGFMEMRLLEGAPLLRLLFTYVRFKFSRLKLLGDGFREALDI